MFGRFAPSPTGDLHVGNLRTAAIAWLAARASGRRFVIRLEDLDRANAAAEHERAQLAALAAIGIASDGVVVRQSERFARYEAAIATLAGAGLVYECFCTRREIADAPTAPHLPPGAYPGTCRELSSAQRRRRAASRPPALRLRAPDPAEVITFADLLLGDVAGGVDDVVPRRNDGVPAYNLAVAVDDAAQQVSQVVRGDDLAASTPRQMLLQRLLGLAHPEYLHVPLVVGADGARLAKRHGAVTLPELEAAGVSATELVSWIGRSIGVLADDEQASTVAELITGFAVERIGRDPVVYDRDRPRSKP